MEKFKSLISKAKDKSNVAVIRMRCGAQAALSNTRGESQNTMAAGFIIASLLIIAAVILWQKGFIQQFFQYVQNTFNTFTGKGS